MDMLNPLRERNQGNVPAIYSVVYQYQDLSGVRHLFSLFLRLSDTHIQAFPRDIPDVQGVQ